MSLTNYAEDKILDALRNVSFAVAGTWIKLHTGDPTETGNVANANNTVRRPVFFTAASNGSITSNAAITWESVSHTEVYSHWSIWDSVGPTGGNPLWKGAFSSNASVTAGDTFQINTLTLTLD